MWMANIFKNLISFTPYGVGFGKWFPLTLQFFSALYFPTEGKLLIFQCLVHSWKCLEKQFPMFLFIFPKILYGK